MRALNCVVATLVLLLGCTPAGGLKPTVWTAPPSYVAEFPLGVVSESDMIAKAGPPDRTVIFDGKKAFVYDVGLAPNPRTFTYVFERGVVADVIYNDAGSYNGISAKASQRAAKR